MGRRAGACGRRFAGTARLAHRGWSGTCRDMPQRADACVVPTGSRALTDARGTLALARGRRCGRRRRARGRAAPIRPSHDE
ncbi:hypothetical protein A8H35_09630 [Burkholderia thailandensis]|uniref:Uncharacterized protein n=1 Tax=Burkholderia thailandensis (strain ATCC 700388 / DSM 13276 / CCUG 48851 / CIP 106301 / E264) TaxID=271848 RepID=Q2SZ38_BURTA|nr:hypothetical protein BTH_I1264 [Burkholderia thailandensis E264]AOJ46335.1 hypothetical protein WJ27_15320 [Burkholderia thailandensis]AVR08626.1 hypothetical protein A8H31_13750 [Burkholderia thailandensis]AWY60344.1 hypothetical protein A8H35_09630 [Burkholderia thailandensis]AWY67188.1 hypothetical protein A8H36_18810 [Burkholderia thailandensis]